VPQELRELLRANQRDGYAVLMKAAAEAIIELARDRRYVGGTVGVLAVLHTWTQQLNYHPHVHCLVTGGGISADGRDWYPAARKAYLFPERVLAKLVRGKLKALLAKRRPDLIAPATAWKKPWVVDITPWARQPMGCCAISRATFTVSPSPIPASSPSMRGSSPSATRNANHRAGAPADYPATSSCAAFCSTFSPRDCTKSATLDSGTPPNGPKPLKSDCACNSIKQIPCGPTG